MQKIQAILFDFDGTLVHSIDLLVEIFVECLTEAGFASDRDVIRRLIGEPLDEIFRKLTESENVAELSTNFREKEDARHTPANIPLIDGALPALKFLHERELQLGIVSTKRRELVDPLARELSIGQFFGVTVGGSDVANPKPDPEPTLLACKKLGVEPAATLFVGDSLLDLRSARSAGATFIGVLTGTATEKDFAENEVEHVLENVGKLAELVQKLDGRF